MANRLKNKVCIITGTGGSMGRAAAQRFAEEGGIVIGCDTNVAAGQETVELVKATGGSMISLHPADLTKMEDCKKLVALAIQEYGRIDVLFNNAAMAHFNWIEDITEDEWRQRSIWYFFSLRRPGPILNKAMVQL
jgi:NAD(P)-dependent dehydrogenase (short-subunit alcohol dehydrogenase family)